MQFSFADQNHRYDDVADHDHRQIWRKIISPDVAEFLLTDRALIGLLEEFPEQSGFAASGTILTKTPPHQRGNAGDREGCICLCVHVRLLIMDWTARQAGVVSWPASWTGKLGWQALTTLCIVASGKLAGFGASNDDKFLYTGL
jgi:hypothetical protein